MGTVRTRRVPEYLTQVPAEPPKDLDEMWVPVTGGLVTRFIIDPHFFQVNPTFEPLREISGFLLKSLKKRGIIDSQGKVTPNGCHGCKAKQLRMVQLRLSKSFQDTILHTMHDPADSAVMLSDLYSYARKKKLVDDGQRLVLFTRDKDGKTIRTNL